MRTLSLLATITKFLLLTCAIITVLSCSTEQKKSLPTYRIGYMICNSEKETLDRFIPLTIYLGQQLNVQFEAVAIDTLNFGKEIDNLHFTHTNSILYIIYNRFNGLDILALEKRGELGDRSKGLVVTTQKSGIKSLEDLKGKRMIFGPMLAPTTFMSQVYALKKLGFDIDTDLASYSFPSGSFKHEKLIYSVEFGKYDAGAFPYLDFETMEQQGKINRNDYIILAEGPPVPYCNFAVTQKTDEKLAQEFKKVLLGIQADQLVELPNGERVNILERAQLDGFTDARDSDFDLLRQMAKETNMPPYQKY
ncbi:MAG: phosphate/phosphite/phosphonate ABC transporter substrate-binding protein [Proteobacteria bacterium]|nr:phosphate/phosphite/phosphonate ABC transporter substrate-binding protein [Desulfobulbaceae bacterium]MBU4151633.1 phosphate/phosphite/phosphonate ABC transporter substrate-binding protein [Pseudomonadota bacterium]MDP2104932.1 phosphate/phosphite/phosphonate ABC transporter substrate-binding protein [Desulfobulbaceae bacterium]